ncbi:hypothetical protein EJ08DRAFT_696526 [Tothia fuscella]|uniref:Uncharacterized protein n=1 Tax=Tothia fuscella TaxID=1048955 RepID=A0A9P4NUH6_9PEZI|nr:hypothetical protein EJ08DRAFT_696526 [Tothia fuscella]
MEIIVALTDAIYNSLPNSPPLFCCRSPMLRGDLGIRGRPNRTLFQPLLDKLSEFGVSCTYLLSAQEENKEFAILPFDAVETYPAIAHRQDLVAFKMTKHRYNGDLNAFDLGPETAPARYFLDLPPGRQQIIETSATVAEFDRVVKEMVGVWQDFACEEHGHRWRVKLYYRRSPVVRAGASS